MDQAKIVSALKSNNLEENLDALDESARVVQILLAESIDCFVNSPYRIPIADRLVRFGPTIVTPLERLFDKPLDQEAHHQIALILLHLGSKAAIRYLLSQLENRGPTAVSAAIALSNANVSEAAPGIRALLEQWSADSDPYAAASLISALKRFGNLPESLKNELRRAWPPRMKQALENLLEGETGTGGPVPNQSFGSFGDSLRDYQTEETGTSTAPQGSESKHSAPRFPRFGDKQRNL